MNRSFDLAIAGSGFGGSLLAMVARRLGYSVVLLEKHYHPRFAIGESATPLANLLLEDLAVSYDLPRLSPLTKWGTWQKTYPEIGCGLKRGFTFYHHTFGKPHIVDSSHKKQLLVAASPNDRIADTHWYRADFDHFLVREAQRLGVEYLDHATITNLIEVASGWNLTIKHHEEVFSLDASFLVDATGPRGFLHHALHLPLLDSTTMPATQGLYSHFVNVKRLEDIGMHPAHEIPPYPIDDAAVHHVFDGGWIWVLRFNNGITSAGVAAEDRIANQLCFAEGSGAWLRLLQQLPVVAEQFSEAKAILPFIHASRLPFHSRRIAGSKWALLPSAAGFVDPLLSTGFPLTLLGIVRLGKIFEKGFDSNLLDELKAYENMTHKELIATESLVSTLYANMHDFPLFISLSMLYFAAASFAEAALRLQRHHLAASFLLTDHPAFGPDMVQILQTAKLKLTGTERKALLLEIEKAIEPVNIAGLLNEERNNWYPVLPHDLMNSAPKLSATEAEIQTLLIRSGFVMQS